MLKCDFYVLLFFFFFPPTRVKLRAKIVNAGIIDREHFYEGVESEGDDIYHEYCDLSVATTTAEDLRNREVDSPSSDFSNLLNVPLSLPGVLVDIELTYSPLISSRKICISDWKRD